MLFYLKKHPLLELAVVLVLGGGGSLAIQGLGIVAPIEVSWAAVVAGALGSLGLALWTLAVQGGYAVVMGRAYSQRLTASLAHHYTAATPVQMVMGLVAAAAEEIFFRGFIQGWFGLFAGAVAFMLAHLGGREIRVIGYWSIFQGLGLGLFYVWSGNLLVPMLAHGLFDMGAMLYFKWFMAGHADVSREGPADVPAETSAQKSSKERR